MRNYGMLGAKSVDYQLTNDLIEQNAGPDRRIVSQVQTPDALNRYQEQLLWSTRPEKHIQEDDEDGNEATVRRSRFRMNLYNYGNELGDQDQAYKPEIVADPQPSRTFEENPGNLFRKELQISRLHANYGEAQKDDILQFPENGPRYRPSDKFKMIPGEVRGMGRIQIDEDVNPLYHRWAVKKGIHNFKNQLADVAPDVSDPTKVKNKKRGRKIGKKARDQQELDENLPEIETNVHEMFAIVARKRKHPANLPQEFDKPEDDDRVKNRDRQRKKPKATGAINTGTQIVDSYLEMAEKVGDIESKLKRGQLRPNLGWRVVKPMIANDGIAGFVKKHISVTKTTDLIPNMEFAEFSDADTGIARPSTKDHYVKKSSNMILKLTRELDQPDAAGISRRFKKRIQPELKHSRAMVTDVFGDDDGVYESGKRLNFNKKGDLSFAQIGYDRTDYSKSEDQIIGRRNQAKQSIMPYTGEVQQDDTGIADIHVDRQTIDKTRVVRKVNRDTIRVDADPYSRKITKSSIHPSITKKRNQEARNAAEKARVGHN